MNPFSFLRSRRERKKAAFRREGLPADIEEKLGRYYRDQTPGRKMSDYLTWDEFCEVFIKEPSQLGFSYRECIVVLEPNYFTIEGAVSEKYETARELLDGAKVCGRPLREVWDELEPMW